MISYISPHGLAMLQA